MEVDQASDFKNKSPHVVAVISFHTLLLSALCFCSIDVVQFNLTLLLPFNLNTRFDLTFQGHKSLLNTSGFDTRDILSNLPLQIRSTIVGGLSSSAFKL